MAHHSPDAAADPASPEAPLLQRIGAETLIVEAGYCELAAPAAALAEGARVSVGAIALLAEAAARMAAPTPEGETLDVSLHTHDLSGAPSADRFLARAELLRSPREGRPLATVQADLFRVQPGGAEALVATALVTVLTSDRAWDRA
ncbi:MAG: hypothetical protein AAGM38_16710 [Pseudomonadota bacterium]